MKSSTFVTSRISRRRLFGHSIWTGFTPGRVGFLPMVGVLGLTGCGSVGDQLTCGEATYEDVGNLEYGMIGTAIDDLSLPIAGARIFVPGTSIDLFTDANGRFTIPATSLNGQNTVEVWAEKDGYPDKVQSVTVPSDRVADISLVMKPFQMTDEIDISAGGTVADGASSVTFDANSLVYADTGELVAGPVEISFVTYSAQKYDELKAAPGSLVGVIPVVDENGAPVFDEAGNPTYKQESLRTLGMIDVAMMQSGRRLELVPGKPAFVELESFVLGEVDEQAIAEYEAELADELSGPLDITIPLWHFNYENANWDLVPDYQWSVENGGEGGYLSLSAYVPEFSPANPDVPEPQCWVTDIEVVPPPETCICKRVMHANGSEPVRGSEITVISRALTHIFVHVHCINPGGYHSEEERELASVMTPLITRVNTNQNGEFCSNGLVDYYTGEGTATIQSVKTYWPGQLDEEDQQVRDTELDGSFDDNHDGLVDPENIIGYLGDTYTDFWNLTVQGPRSCGAPDGDIEVECINEPVDPETGDHPE